MFEEDGYAMTYLVEPLSRIGPGNNLSFVSERVQRAGGNFGAPAAGWRGGTLVSGRVECSTRPCASSYNLREAARQERKLFLMSTGDLNEY